MPIQIIPYYPSLSCHPAQPFSLRQEELAAAAVAVVVAAEVSCQARQRQEAKGEPADQVQL